MATKEQEQGMREQIAFFANSVCVTKCPTRKAKGSKWKMAHHQGIRTQYRIANP